MNEWGNQWMKGEWMSKCYKRKLNWFLHKWISREKRWIFLSINSLMNSFEWIEKWLSKLINIEWMNCSLIIIEWINCLLKNNEWRSKWIMLF